MKNTEGVGIGVLAFVLLIGILARHHLCTRVFGATIVVDGITTKASIYRDHLGGVLVALPQALGGMYVVRGSGLYSPSRSEYHQTPLLLITNDTELVGVNTQGVKIGGPDARIRYARRAVSFTIPGNRRVAVDWR